MNTSEAFNTLTHHADKRHDFMVRTIGQDALLAAFEMRSIREDAVAALDDDEFVDYLSDVQDTDDSLIESPEELYLDGYSAFTSRADELFGMIEGYRLTGADEKGLFLDKMVAAPADALAATERLIAEVVEDSIVISKKHHVMAGTQSGITNLPVTERDTEIIHEALERLKLVNESLE